ncbi:MAG: hypothetical protein J7639_16305 [Paenibacillaceae bacterium]|nr:hypothetical protein [Paenibacillaceae bacterium]
MRKRHLFIPLFCWLIGLSFLFGVGAPVPVALAQPQLLAATGWTAEGPGTRAVGETEHGVAFTYDYTETGAYDGETWRFYRVAEQAGDLSFNWRYNALHSWYEVSAKVTAYVLHDGTTTETVLYQSNGSGGDLEALGSSTLHVAAGETYGFRISGSNFDSSRIFRGRLELATAPIIRSTVSGTAGSNGWYKSDVTVGWQVTDGATPPASCPPVAVTADTPPEGTAVVCQAGAASASVVVKRDATAPVTTDNAPPGWSNGNVTVQLTAADSSSGVAATYYKVGTGIVQSGATIVFTTDGEYTIAYWSVDAAGNAETPKTAVVRIQKDTLADATFQPDVTSWTNGDVLVSVAYPANAGTRLVSTDNVTWTPYVEPVTVSVNSVVYAKYQEDGGTAWSGVSSYAVVNIDKQAPATTAAAAVDPGTNYITVQLAASDEASGVSDTYYQVDGGQAVQAGSSVQLRTHGAHTLIYWSVDAAGNSESPRTMDVSVNLLPDGESGRWSIADVLRLVRQGAPQQKEMNDDGVFDAQDVAIMLGAIAP